MRRTCVTRDAFAFRVAAATSWRGEGDGLMTRRDTRTRRRDALAGPPPPPVETRRHSRDISTDVSDVYARRDT